MSESFFVIDIRRSYEYEFEGQSDNIEIPFCKTHTYTFQTDEGYRYVLLVDVFEDICLLGLKFHRAADFESKHKYNVLTAHKNPFRFFSTILCILKKEVIVKFPNYSIIAIGEPTLEEIEKAKETHKNSSNNTKRFKFYKRFLAEMIYSGSYTFIEKKERSVFLLAHNTVSDEMFSAIENFLLSYGFSL